MGMTRGAVSKILDKLESKNLISRTTSPIDNRVQFLTLTGKATRALPILTKAIANVQAAQQRALAIRPKVGGFPYLAETLRRAGVTRNVWFLPACESLYLTDAGAVVMQGTPLLTGAADVPQFDQTALITVLRTDQAGESTFPQFLDASWRAGVVRYEVDLNQRTVTYYGCNGETYAEHYPSVEIPL
jgi:uncharacterized protein YbcV (DUF1398 family)